MKVGEFPYEAVNHILAHLPAMDKVHLGLICRRMAEVTVDSVLGQQDIMCLTKVKHPGTLTKPRVARSNFLGSLANRVSGAFGAGVQPQAQTSSFRPKERTTTAAERTLLLAKHQLLATALTLRRLKQSIRANNSSASLILFKNLPEQPLLQNIPGFLQLIPELVAFAVNSPAESQARNRAAAVANETPQMDEPSGSTLADELRRKGVTLDTLAECEEAASSVQSSVDCAINRTARELAKLVVAGQGEIGPSSQDLAKVEGWLQILGEKAQSSVAQRRFGLHELVNFGGERHSIDFARKYPAIWSLANKIV